jgi:formylglycine-generating enzyme required for sulfatase activity
MTGNVDEWLAEWYEARAYRRYARGDLSAPAKGRKKVITRGAFRYLYPDLFLSPHRCDGFEPSFRIDVIGFRCARDV